MMPQPTKLQQYRAMHRWVIDDSTNLTGPFFRGEHSSHLVSHRTGLNCTKFGKDIDELSARCDANTRLDFKYIAAIRNHRASKVTGVERWDLTISKYGHHLPSWIWPEVNTIPWPTITCLTWGHVITTQASHRTDVHFATAIFVFSWLLTFDFKIASIAENILKKSEPSVSFDSQFTNHALCLNSTFDLVPTV